MTDRATVPLASKAADMVSEKVMKSVAMFNRHAH